MDGIEKLFKCEQFFLCHFLGLASTKTKVVEENQAKACYEKNTRKVT